MKVPRPVKYPPIEVWVEIIDPRTVALHACRRWPGAGPRLTAWRILSYVEPVQTDPWVWRVRGEQLLLDVEARTNPRWYKYAQRNLERIAEHGRFDVQVYWAVREWHEINAAPQPPGEPR